MDMPDDPVRIRGRLLKDAPVAKQLPLFDF